MTLATAAPGIGRTDPGYEIARGSMMWNALVPERFPARIVHARSVSDVQEAVRYAVREGLRVTVKSGGHSWAGNHLREDAVLIDVSALDEVRIDASALTAVVGPGKRGNQLAAELLRIGLFFPVGHCEGVRLGGYLLQGGFGWNGRALGMACQNVLAIDYVDAEGELRHASELEDPDMLWAARGAGPGFFGIVVAFHLRLFPRSSFIGVAAAAYPEDRIDEVFAWADRVGPEVASSVELDLLLSRETVGVRGLGVQVSAVVFADSWRQARWATAFLNSRPRGARLALPATPVPLSVLYRNAMRHYPSAHRYAVDNMWTHASYRQLRPGITRIAETLPESPSHMLWMNWRPPARPDMAFSVEDDTYIALYGGWADPSQDEANAAWSAQRMADMSAYSSGIQLADENLGRRPAPFVTDAHLARLDALRAARDPHARFHPWMGRP